MARVLRECRIRAVRRQRRAAAAANNLWAPPPTFVDRGTAADNLSRAADAIFAEELFCCNFL